jgi:uncharacterized protein (DUF427 family)
LKNPLDLIHRIVTKPVEGRVRVEIDGEVVAESDRALELDERGVRLRHYLPREDILAELLPSDKRTTCPFKGQATHYSIRVGDATHESIAWSYEEPKDSVAEIRGLVAFYDERVDLTVSGA